MTTFQKKALMLEVNRQRKREKPKQTRRREVEEFLKRIGLEMDEVANRTRWRERECERSLR